MGLGPEDVSLLERCHFKGLGYKDTIHGTMTKPGKNPVQSVISPRGIGLDSTTHTQQMETLLNLKNEFTVNLDCNMIFNTYVQNSQMILM